jgi:CMP-N,N'-diacetyllegionaminic acid synthase
MHNNKTFVCVIPARGGSKGVHRKNIRLLAGKPLVAYSIERSLQSKLVDRTIVSTEDEEIAEVCKSCGAEVVKRPIELAGDHIDNEPVMLHVLKCLRERENFVPDYVVLLEPTGIFRRKSDIDNAIGKITDENGDSLLSVYECDVFFWSRDAKALNYDYKHRPRRQDKLWEFVENGAITITRTEILTKEKCRLGGKIILYEMPKEISCEIDTIHDFETAECMLKQKEIMKTLNREK